MSDQYGINLGEVYANVDAIQTAKLRNQLLQDQMADSSQARTDRNTLRSVAPAAMRGDAAALSTYASLDPEGAMRLQSWAEGQDEKQRAKSVERVEYAGNVLNYVRQMPEAEQAQGWADAVAMASEDDPEMGAAMKKLMPQYDPRRATMLMARTSHAAEMIANQKASKTAADVDSAIRGVNEPKMVERERVSTVPASMIRQELMARGLPEHVAEGFVLNMQDESGLNPGINEKNPVVAGSRGGFGLYQLTGPRRVAYEQWASKHGRALDDPSAQLDFLAMELEGPERAAADKIMATSTPGEAASAIATYFLRPSKEHLAARVEKYMEADPSQPRTSATDLIAMKARPDLNEQQQAAIDLVLGMMQPPEPLSPEGKLEADRRNGLAPAPVPDFRQASPEEAAAYGAVAGQFGPDGRFYPMNPPSGMAIESDGEGGFRMTQGPGVAASSRPLNEGQSKNVIYATRAEGALPVIEQIGGALTSRTDQAAGAVPFGLGRSYQDPQYQMAQQAGDEFLTAILRKDTGAAITTQEQAIYGGTYLPQPGDSPELLQQKAQSRARAVEALRRGMTPAEILALEKGNPSDPNATIAPSAPTTYRFNPQTGQLEVAQ